MDSPTFRSRLTQLMQKSRKAVRLYSGVTRIRGEGGSEHSEAQARQWEDINRDLLRQLQAALDCTDQRRLSHDVFAIREHFYFEWRSAEAHVHQKQCELLSRAENGDFIKAAIVAEELVRLKARMEASQAVHHEVCTAISQSRLSTPPKDAPQTPPDTVSALTASEKSLLNALVAKDAVSAEDQSLEETRRTAVTPSVAEVIPLKRVNR